MAMPPRVFAWSAELNFTGAAMDLPRAARASLWEGDLDGVRAVLVGLDAGDLHGRVLDLERRAIGAALSAYDGDREGAGPRVRRGPLELNEMGLAYKQTHVVLDMARPGPDDPVVRASVDDARAILERLGARAFLARLDELMGERSDSGSGGSSVHAPESDAAATGDEAGAPVRG